MLLIVVYSCLFVFFMRRLFGTKCAKCSQGFSKNDCVMRARNKIYHIDCFRCLACARQLIPGDEFALRENGLFCKADHDVLERTTPDATTVMMVNNNNNGNHQNFMNSEYDWCFWCFVIQLAIDDVGYQSIDMIAMNIVHASQVTYFQELYVELELVKILIFLSSS